MARIVRILPIVGAATLALAPLAAGADETMAFSPSSSPVAVHACAVGSKSTILSYVGALQTTDGLQLSFANRNAVTATSVTFRVRYNSEEQTIVERGSFAPGSLVSRDLPEFANRAYVGDDAVCAVTAVQLADGSTLLPPSEPVAMSPTP